MLFNENKSAVKLFLYCCGLDVNYVDVNFHHRPMNLNTESPACDGAWEVDGGLLD